MSEELLSKIDHVVVLMLENRSFDNVLGHLFGLDASSTNKLVRDGDDETIASWTTDLTRYPAVTRPDPDPAERFRDMNQQIFGLVDRPEVDDRPTEPGDLGPMGGFVQSYAEQLDRDTSDTPVRDIMNYMSRQQMPVTACLAESFVVVDTYHASAPCQTMPNRCFAQLGTAQGFVNNKADDGTPHQPYFGKTIFGQIRDKQAAGADVDWRCYFGDVPLTLAMLDVWEQLDSEHFRLLDAFEDDAASGDLPAYTWIEPAYQLEPNDNHPPHDVTLGEGLLARIYNALRSSPLWERTLFVLTYDEHGGTYDRVYPPPATSPGGDDPDNFTFDRYGVRVPTILCSHWTLQEGVHHTTGPDVYDHTSILATLRKRFDLGPPLSAREAAACTFDKLLRDPLGGQAPTDLVAPDPVGAALALAQQIETDFDRLHEAKEAGVPLKDRLAMAKENLKELFDQLEDDVTAPIAEELLDKVVARLPEDPLVDHISKFELKALQVAVKVLRPLAGAGVDSSLQRLVAWIAKLVAEHHAEHLETPITAERAGEIRQALGRSDDLSGSDVAAAVDDFHALHASR